MSDVRNESKTKIDPAAEAMHEMMARQNALESLTATVLSTLFSAFSPEQRAAFLNDIFIRRADAGQRAAGAPEGIAELEAATDRHLARFMQQTAAQFRSSCLDVPKS